MSKHTLFTLHPEILLSIVDRLTSFKDLNSLVRTCRALQNQLDPILYRIAARSDVELLPYLCHLGGCKAAAVAKLLAAGADPFFQQVIEMMYRPNQQDNDSCATASKTFMQELGPRARQQDSIFWPISSQRDEVEENELRTRKSPGSNIKGFRTMKEFEERFERSGDLAARCHFICWSPMHVAAQRGNVGVLRVLLQHDKQHAGNLIDVPSSGYCPVIETHREHLHSRHRILSESIKKIETTRHTQADIWTFHTPLRTALCAEEEDAAIFLIDHGAKLHFTSEAHQEYDHVLHVAAYHGCDRVIKHLLTTRRAEVDINILDSNGWTPLCNAIIGSTMADTLNTIIELGADVNFPLHSNNNNNNNNNNPRGTRNDGLTHLHLACWHQQWYQAAILVRAGAAVNHLYTPAPTSLPRDHTFDCQSLRAIDIVCMETVEPAFDPDDQTPWALQDHEITMRNRTDLLATLVSKHGSAIFSMETLNDDDDLRGKTTLRIAASHPTEAVALLTAFRDAPGGGVYFHRHEGLILRAMLGPQGLHPVSVSKGHKSVRAVEWLVRHGAKVGKGKESQALVEGGIWILVRRLKLDGQGVVHPLYVGYLQEMGDMVYNLVVKAGLDPNVLSSHGLHSHEKHVSLFRALARDKDVYVATYLSKGLARAGAKMPELIEVWKDWLGVLPRMEPREVAKYHRDAEKRAWILEEKKKLASFIANSDGEDEWGYTDEEDESEGESDVDDHQLADVYGPRGGWKNAAQLVSDAVDLIGQTTTFIRDSQSEDSKLGHHWTIPSIKETLNGVLGDIVRDDAVTIGARPISMSPALFETEREKAAGILQDILKDWSCGMPAEQSWDLTEGFAHRVRVLMTTVIQSE